MGASVFSPVSAGIVLVFSCQLLVDWLGEEGCYFVYGLGDDGVLDASKFRGRELNDWLRSGYDPRLQDVSKDNRVLIWHLKAEDEGELLW